MNEQCLGYRTMVKRGASLNEVPHDLGQSSFLQLDLLNPKLQPQKMMRSLYFLEHLAMKGLAIERLGSL